MRLLGFIYIICVWIFANPAIAEKNTLGPFSRGEPGCLHLVGSVALTAAQQKNLPPKCRMLRKNYEIAVTQLASQPLEFKKNISSSIQKAKASGEVMPPYDALLFTVLTQDLSQLAVIEEYMKYESKKKVQFRYAAAALERLQQGECKEFKGYAYEEICKSSDPVLDRLVALNKQMQNKNTRSKK